MNRPTDELRDLIERTLREFEMGAPAARQTGVVDDWRRRLTEACDRLDGATTAVRHRRDTRRAA
jgi:hypothetical protein